jgi:hypothetical protein
MAAAKVAFHFVRIGVILLTIDLPLELPPPIASTNRSIGAGSGSQGKSCEMARRRI